MPLFFIHIPKTAGTSFRLGSEEVFGKSSIAYDYGLESNKTSSEILSNIYSESPDYWRFYQYLSRCKIQILGGHVDAAKYAYLIGSRKTITFLRDPLQRTASEYAHKVRHHGYKGTFYDFYMRPQMHNRQSKILHGVHLESFGFVGITEHYSKSITVFNKQFNSNVPQREDNQGRRNLGILHEISHEDRKNLEVINKKDIMLYKNASNLLQQRFMFYENSLPWAHARVMECNTKHLAGWAWYSRNSDVPVDIEVWVNDVYFTTIMASAFRPGLLRLLPPRGGYVGFHLSVEFACNDLVQCRVARTGQKFPIQPIKVTEA